VHVLAANRPLRPHRAAMGAVLCLAMAPPAQAEMDAPLLEPRHVSVYVAKNASDRFKDIVTDFSADFRSSYLGAVTYSTTLTEGRWIRWELEGQFVQHAGMQSHQELNGVLVARWMHFPWDNYVNTRFAFGEGISIASRVPPLEPRSDPDEEESTRVLNYLLVELEFAPPGDSRWSSFIRVHHRSGVYGLFGNVKGGSNFVGLGVRYRL
jgi:hypothetical protein